MILPMLKVAVSGGLGTRVVIGNSEDVHSVMNELFVAVVDLPKVANIAQSWLGERRVGLNGVVYYQCLSVDRAWEILKDNPNFKFYKGLEKFQFLRITEADADAVAQAVNQKKLDFEHEDPELAVALDGLQALDAFDWLAGQIGNSDEVLEQAGYQPAMRVDADTIEMQTEAILLPKLLTEPEPVPVPPPN